jgi:hypothetical protein
MMKQSTLIALAVGAIIVCAAILLVLNLSPPEPSAAPTPLPPAVKTTADVLEKFDALKAKVNASGHWFGGAATQILKGDETAMVYLYKPVGSSDMSGLLADGYSALYSTFEDRDPLLVGLIDTTQKISEQQYKVDVYALERPFVELYASGDIAKAELVKKALYVTPETESLRASGSQPRQPEQLPKPSKNYTPPADRQAYVTLALNESGYRLLNLQTGVMQDGEKAVSLAYMIPSGLTNGQKYEAIDAGLKACAGAFGDLDRYYLNLISEKGNEYYVIDAASTPVLDYMEGSISQAQLYRNINLTYYTK